jgi:hypothetical protein
MRTYHVNMNPPYLGAGYCDNRLHVEGYSISFGVGEVEPGKSGRREMNGEIVNGPWAYVYGKASIIDNNGGTKREVEEQRNRECVVDAKLGDILEINGREYIIEKSTDPYYVQLSPSN